MFYLYSDYYTYKLCKFPQGLHEARRRVSVFAPLVHFLSEALAELH